MEEAREATESSVQSLEAKKLALSDGIKLWTTQVEEHGVTFTTMRQDGHRKVEDVLFEGDGLKVGLDTTASQFSGVINSLTVVYERYEQQCGRSVATLFAAWVASSVFSFPFF